MGIVERLVAPVPAGDVSEIRPLDDRVVISFAMNFVLWRVAIMSSVDHIWDSEWFFASKGQRPERVMGRLCQSVIGALDVGQVHPFVLDE